MVSLTMTALCLMHRRQNWAGLLRKNKLFRKFKIVSKRNAIRLPVLTKNDFAMYIEGQNFSSSVISVFNFLFVFVVCSNYLHQCYSHKR